MVDTRIAVGFVAAVSLLASGCTDQGLGRSESALTGCKPGNSPQNTITCPNGLHCCVGQPLPGHPGVSQCRNLLNDESNCGSCGHPCNTQAAPECINGQCGCSGKVCVGRGLGGFVCKDILSDPTNCGDCGIDCSANNPDCIAGQCQCGTTTCQRSETCCGPGDCRDLGTQANCGACGRSCGFLETCNCRDGACACAPIACDPGRCPDVANVACCNHECVSTTTAEHCGGCAACHCGSQLNFHCCSGECKETANECAGCVPGF